MTDTDRTPERLSVLLGTGLRSREIRRTVSATQLFLRGLVDAREAFTDVDPSLREGVGDTAGLAPTIGMDDLFCIKAAAYAEFFVDVSDRLVVKSGEQLGKTAMRWDSELSKGYLGDLDFERFMQLTFEQGMYRRVLQWSSDPIYADAIPLLDQLSVEERILVGHTPEIEEFMFRMYQGLVIGEYLQLPHTLAIVTAMTFANSVLGVAHREGVDDQEEFLRKNLPRVNVLMQLGSSEFSFVLDRLVDTHAYPQQMKKEYVMFDADFGSVHVDLAKAFFDFVPEDRRDPVHRRCPIVFTEPSQDQQTIMDSFFETIVRMYMGTGALNRPSLRKLDGFMKDS